jgi:hypothetical protein
VHAGLGELVAWHLVDKKGGWANPWEGGGLGFDPSSRGLTS